MIIGIIQIGSTENKDENIRKALEFSEKAIEEGSELIVLPELFNFISAKGNKEDYLKNAETDNGLTINSMLKIAKSHNVLIIAGSITEIENEKLYNTSYVISSNGILGKYRKIHLFKYSNIDESKIFNPGKDPLVIDYNNRKIGITICFDLRFPELFRLETIMGAELIVNISAFLEETGRKHWIPLLKARAIENQIYLVAANQALTNIRRYYGHSCIIDPWGKILCKASNKEEVIIQKIDFNKVKEVREKMPIKIKKELYKKIEEYLV
ncbi:MAG: carbon-nitrogen hydrolase family protein [Candidatus Methanomethylicia archaeon]|jgi:predicted amidohydrolase|uniref:Carbon-nitrogen hydrolase family protein n=1 Tax=Thermoproteota archaeon TaxID=2056631 RepID=A0A523BC33_9CREN|nr:carbon-nitrogen hydrolase family protein [Candidatus Methanomethylicia archaeon]RZN56780.1 MAG: carbon-nitrogen hydrolase family protein [Candidatus Verstraetearchaeota archaeon]TDA38465.1 MAG: carbon-nitrogen hydrolase family protein [Candidatus Verstraetearchaeota archaeon]